jgi:hypothetical protein
MSIPKVHSIATHSRRLQLEGTRLLSRSCLKKWHYKFYSIAYPANHHNACTLYILLFSMCLLSPYFC